MLNYLLSNLSKTFFNKYYWQSISIIVRKNYKVDYGASYLGNLWMIIRPFILISVYAVVFSKITRFEEISNYPFFLTTNITLWIFIAGIISSTPDSLLSRSSIIKLCPISKTSFIIVDLIKQLKIYLISLIIIYCIIGLIFSIEFHKTILLFPFYLIMILMILFSLSVGLAYIQPYFRDIKTLIDSSLPALMWLTPIIYPASILTGKLALIIKFSPFTILITPINKILFHGEIPNLFDHLALLGLLIITTTISLIIHKKCARNVVYYM